MVRLQKLNIKGYKNIQDQQFDFSANQGLIALVGENGSGKSNLLEAISSIFNSVLLESSVDFEYVVEYTIGTDSVRLTNATGSLSCEVNGTNKTSNEIKDHFVPSRIIANYSGEDLRLFSSCYKPSYDKFTKQLKAQDALPTLQMVYINKYYWDLCLLSLYFADHTVKTDIADFCSTQLGIKSVQSITFEIDFEVAKNWKDNEPRQLLEAIFAVEDLYKITELDNGNDKGIVIVEEKAKKVSAKITLTLDAFKDRTNTLYGEDEKFFLYLFAAFTSKENRLLKGIDFTIELSNDSIVGVEALSEGEKKLILIEFITKILGNENSLVLLDEPDAHTHISRKKELLSAVKSFEGQTILTTHSPVFVNEIHNNSAGSLYFIKEGSLENGELINKLVALSGGLLDYIEGSVVFASKNILALEGLSDIKCLRKAFNVFSNKDAKYQKLKSVQLVSFGGTGNAPDLFTQVLVHHMDHIDHLIYLFDNDGAGKSGNKSITECLQKPEYTGYTAKVKSIFYKDGANNFELEDFFPQGVYNDIVTQFHALNTYRDFKDNKQKITDKIKDKVKDKVDLFQPEDFDDFEPLLDTLLQEFGLA